MKQLFLIGVCLTNVFTGNSQNDNSPLEKFKLRPEIANVEVRTNVKSMSDGFNSNDVQTKGKFTNAKKAPAQPSTLAVTQIGTTVYQLQTNASSRNALFKNNDGTVAAVWTYSNTDPAVDRGTGYAYFNGTSWSSQPSSRIESQRTGWPSIAITGNNEEIVINHNNTVNELELVSRPGKGTGTWTSSTAKLTGPSPGGNVWPRMVVGGTNNNTLHVISLTAPTSSGGVKYNHQMGSLCYSRSQDGGVTWDKKHTSNQLIDSANGGFNGFAGDNYAIDARGNVVAYVAGNKTSDLVLIKSTDNGNTWTKKIILDFPINNFNGQVTDINTDGTVDTLETNDGSMAILLDNNDVAHVWYGLMRVMNKTLNDSGSYSYFPGTSGLMYWNENMGNTKPEIIAGLTDYDNSGKIELPAATSGRPYGTFGSSLTSHPSAGIDVNGKIYLAYDALIENTNDGNSKAIRNIMIMGSFDNGATWSNPIRPNPDDNFEQVFPSAARYVNNCMSYIYQNDDAAGHGIGTSNPDAIANPSSKSAEIYYDCISVSSIIGVEENNMELASAANYPNPFSGKTYIDITLINSSNLSVEVFNTMGQKVLATANKHFVAGPQTIAIDAANLKPGIYFYTLKTNTATVTNKMIVQ